MKMLDPDILSQTLAEPSRRAILENLRFGQKSVTELVDATGLKQPNVSNHLAKMRQQGIVRSERFGRHVFYGLATPFAEVLMRLYETVADPLQQALSTRRKDEMPQAGQSPRPGNEEASSPGETASLSTSESDLAEWRQAYFQSILMGQEERAVALVNGMLARRLSMERIYTDVFQWALYQVGELYAGGLTDEAHEHVASAITERMMAKVAQFYTPMTRTSYRAVLGCVADNWHTLGLRMLADGLKGLGWETLFVGANVPSGSFVAMVASARPDLVVVSCSIEAQLPQTRDLLVRLRQLSVSRSEQRFLLVAGGFFFVTHPEAAADLPIDFTAPDLPHFLDAVRHNFPPAVQP